MTGEEELSENEAQARSAANAVPTLLAYLDARIGAKTWRKLHYLSFCVFLSAVAHGLFAGSDSGVTGIQILYVVSGTALGLLILYRVAVFLKGTRS